MSEPKGPERARRLGDFEILRELGRGGMGIVYEARQVSLNRRVALKVLSSGIGLSSKAVVRFRREAEAAAKLHHTNIVPIYATGEEDGTHFYAMELIEGPSLNVVIRELRRAERASTGRRGGESESGVQAGDTDQQGAAATDATSLPPWLLETITSHATPSHSPTAVSDSSTTLTTGGGYFDSVARLAAEVADALDYAHDQGVIHRDIKPSNLLLSPSGRMSINDFGLARMLEQPGMTMTGEFMGSPLYMSPEQITAGRAPLDHRTDIYSLGATLYELLTLQPPFPGERRDQIIAQIMGKEPKSPRRLNRKVPVDLDTICLKAMEKDPDRRYQTAGQMAEDLRRFVNRFAISAKRAGPVARTVKWVRRRPAMGALIALVLVAAGTAGYFAHRSHQQHLQRIAEEGQHSLDQALLEAFSGHYDAVEPWLERAEVLDVDPGRIRVLRGLAAVEQGDAEGAVHELELATQQLPVSLGARALLARAYLEAGRWDEAWPLWAELEKLTPQTPEDYLYGGWALYMTEPERADDWLETLAAEHPTPAVHYVLGFHRTFDLMESYDPSDIDQTLAHTGAAKTQMPDNVRALWFDSLAHLVAADIRKLEGNTALHAYHLSQAKQNAAYVLKQHADAGDSHFANATIAGFEGRWEDALNHSRNGRECLVGWPGALGKVPEYLYLLGRYEEALAELDALPDGLRTSRWCCERVFIVAELEGVALAEATWRDSSRPQ